MIEIKNSRGHVLHTVDADTLIGADLSGLDLTDANLRGADLSHAKLVKTNLSYACLENADFNSAELDETQFDGADLRAANFRTRNTDASYRGDRTGIEAVSFIDADLRNANFCKCEIFWSSFYDADLRGAHFKDAEFFGDDMEFAFADARNADFSFATFNNVQLKGEGEDDGLPYLCGADFTEASFLESFIDAHLDGANFMRARLARATFSPYVQEQLNETVRR
jgi:uncharacterized protein YjbI with pentapeptide repeats